MIRGIHHTAISTGDLDRAIEFYRDLLGFEVTMEYEWHKGREAVDRMVGLKGSAARGAMLRLGNAYIELLEYSSPTPKKSDPDRASCDHGITHICMDVVDIEAEYKRLKAAGMSFHCPPQDVGGAKGTYGRDPEGNIVELQEVLDDTSPMKL